MFTNRSPFSYLISNGHFLVCILIPTIQLGFNSSPNTDGIRVPFLKSCKQEGNWFVLQKHESPPNKLSLFVFSILLDWIPVLSHVCLWSINHYFDKGIIKIPWTWATPSGLNVKWNSVIRTLHQHNQLFSQSVNIRPLVPSYSNLWSIKLKCLVFSLYKNSPYLLH